jgi:hypothetical protein
MAEATSYNLSGVRENLTDFLTILEPEDTPKLSMLSKGKRPTNTYQEWQMDTLSAPAFGGVIEGTDVTQFANKAANRARAGNYIQLFRRPWMVSRIAEEIDVAGVANEVANAKMKCMREIKRDIEAMIGSDQDRQQDNGTVPYLSRALGAWISASGPSDIPAAYRTPSASVNTTATASLTEDGFNSVFQSLFEVNGGKRSYTLFAGPSLKRAISKFQRQEGTTTAKSYQVTQDASEHRIDLNVEIYSGDFHTVTIIPDLFNGLVSDSSGTGTFAPTNQSRARGYIIDPDLVSLGYMIGMESVELPDQGGGRRGFIHCVNTLMAKNPRGLGKFAASS